MSRPLMIFVVVAPVIAFGAIASGSAKTRLVVAANDADSRVQFVSDAPLEKITGVGHSVRGEVEFDPTAVQQTRGKLELDVDSIKTNVALRDEHLRGANWLDAAKYPKITFEIKRVEGGSELKPGAAAELKVHGKLSMHGVTRDEVATAKVRWTPATGMKVQAHFKVSLPNYNVSVPSLVRLKVSDEIALNVMLSITPKGH